MKTTKQKSNILKKAKKAKEYEIETNTALYGKAGTGKTTLFSTFPAPRLLIDCSEKGTDSIRDTDTDVIRCETFEELELIYWALKKEPKKYKSVAIDTVSHAQDLCVKQILEEHGKQIDEGAIGNWGTMRKQDWGEVATAMKTLILNFRDLPINMVFIAHDRSFNMDDDEDSTLLPSVGPRLSPSVVATLNAAVSIIGNTFIKQDLVEKKIKIKGKTKTKKKMVIKYCLRIGPHAIYTTKIRKPKEFQLPDLIEDPTYKKILDIIRGVE